MEGQQQGSSNAGPPSQHPETAPQEPTVSVVSAPTLSWLRILSFGVGHFHNDMCASMWFTYLLIFSMKVLEFSPAAAGNLILIGQVTDALCTPLIGFESDRLNVSRCCLKYGRRKTWHFIGFICVTCSFAFLFIECFGCRYQKTSKLIELLYYVPFIVIFQFGWASMQISHLALIPDLSSCQHERATLNGIRYAFTVIANIVVFILVYFFIGQVDTDQKQVTHDDAKWFSYVAISVTALGCIFSMLFHIGTKESWHPHLHHRFRRHSGSSSSSVGNGPQQKSDSDSDDSDLIESGHDNNDSGYPDTDSILQRNADDDSDDVIAAHRSSTNREQRASLRKSTNQERPAQQQQRKLSLRNRHHMIWSDWFKNIDFYLVAVLYMATRIFGNVTQAYLPQYVLDTQHFSKQFIAIIPMIVYLSSFFASGILSLQSVNRYFPRKVLLLLGIVLGTAACVWMYFHNLHYQIYGLSVLLGMASTILLVVSLALIADLINNNTESGAFVYGSMSFMDKISTGIAIQIVQQLKPACNPTIPCISSDKFFRDVMVYVPGGALALAFVSLTVLWPRNVGERSRGDIPSLIQQASDEDSLIG